MMSRGSGDETSYRSWAACGIGSSVTTESQRDVPGGFRMIISNTTTLLSVHPEKVRLSWRMKMNLSGGPVSAPGSESEQVIEVPATLNAMPDYEETTEDPADGGSVTVIRKSWPAPQADPTFQEGDETIEVAGRLVPCHWIQRSMDAGEQRIRFRAWLSDHIPGGLARSESRFEGNPSEDTVTVVTSFEKKSQATPTSPG